MKKEGKNLSLSSAKSARWRNNPNYKFHKGRSKTIAEAAKNVDFTPDITQKELNPLLWNEDGTLKTDMRSHLLKIAKEFKEFLGTDSKLKDVTITGSMANHNWTEFSDIDLHLIMDFSEIDANKDFVRDFMDMKKALWGLKHDIKIDDFDVELYAQDEDDEHHSSGVFSLRNNEWIERPSKNDVKVDTDLVRKKADYVATLIDGINGIDDDDDKVEAIDEMKEKIRKMRQSGLDKDGEYSAENLAFKVLRNTGYLDKLSDMKTDAMDSILSLKEHEHNIDEEAVSKKQQKFFGIVRALQTGEIKPSQTSKSAKGAAKKMSKKDVLDFAETDHEGLPSKVEESEEKPMYEHGCLMSNFNMPTWKKNILSKIDDDDLYTGDSDERYGLEDEPHVTVLYGVHDNEVDFEDLKNAVDKKMPEPIRAKVKGVSIFENKDYDVVKLEIESDQLNEMNSMIRENFPYTNNFTDYNPHMTIAYVKPGMGKKYVSNFKDPFEIQSNEMFYSSPSGDKVNWMPNNDSFNRQISFNKHNGVENTLSVMSNEISTERVNYIKDFIQFVCDNVYMENSIHVFLRNGRDEYIRTTASYVPSENTNHINCKGRALVDICRSIAHELTHNRQREIEKFVIGQDIPNIGGEIENEADSVAGMLIKRYTHDNGHESIYDL